MRKFSVIIPVYNRPGEIKELLESLTKQTYRNFEVLVIEDGSADKCEHIVENFKRSLEVKYFYKENSGPGLTRNFGVQKAMGDFYVFFDSDCLIPENYFAALHSFLTSANASCYGGPDKSHSSFTPVQKAISYSMTSVLTTGGIRGGKKKISKFHPRSFNMGFSFEVFKATGGFSSLRFGEDIDLSLRIEEAGFQCHLISEAFVYHKRRTSFKTFYKQIYNSGIARINLFKRHKQALKTVHFFPALFTLFTIGSAVCSLVFMNILFLLPVLLYLFLIFADSFRENKSLHVALLSVIAAIVQLVAYGLGFMKAFWKRLILREQEFSAFQKNFYK